MALALHTACAEIADELSAETGSNVDEKTIRNLYHDRFEFLYSLLTPDDASIEGVEDWIFDNLLAIEEFRASMDPFVNFNRSVTKI